MKAHPAPHPAAPLPLSASAPLVVVPQSVYMDALMQGGANCWWCNETCVGPCVPMPTRPAPPWGLVGFFCCVGCSKAYMLQRKLPVSYLKLYVRTYAGIPFSCALPCSPPWQTLIKYGPPAGVLTLEEYRNAKWASMSWSAESASMPTRMGRIELETNENAKKSAGAEAGGRNSSAGRPKRSQKESERTRSKRKAIVVTRNAAMAPPTANHAQYHGQCYAERLVRKGPKAVGGILSFFTCGANQKEPPENDSNRNSK